MEEAQATVDELDDARPTSSSTPFGSAAKRLRYASEAVAPLLGKPARDLAQAAAELQDILGEHNDAVVAARWLRGPMSNSRSVRTAFVAGELAGLERWAAAETRDQWGAAWKRLRDRRLRSWM